MCVITCIATVQMWRPRDHLQDLVPSSCVGPGDQTQVSVAQAGLELTVKQRVALSFSSRVLGLQFCTTPDSNAELIFLQVRP